MIDTTTTPPPPPSPPPAPPRMVRPSDDRLIGGVCAAVARQLRVDPLLVRLLWVAAIFVGGIGVVAYVLGWVFIPGDGGERSGLRPETARTIGVVLAVVAAAIFLDDLPGIGGITFPVVLIALGVWLLLRSSGRLDGTALGPTRRDPDDEPTQDPFDGTAPLDPNVGPAEPAPRRRTPTTLATLGVLAVYAGLVIGIVAADAASVTAAGVVAGALAITGIGLVAGAFVGGGRLLLLLVVPLLAALALTSFVDLRLDGGVGERTFVPTAVDDIPDEYRLGVGQLVVDLTELDLDRAETVEVDASLGAGELRIVVPDGVRVRGEASADLGSLVILDAEPNDGSDVSDDIDVDAPEGAATIVIEAEVGVGELRVEVDDD